VPTQVVEELDRLKLSADANVARGARQANALLREAVRADACTRVYARCVWA
jgi:predicted ribonuclease YlaK